MVIIDTLLTDSTEQNPFDKLRVTQVFQKSAVFYTTQKFITVLNGCVIHRAVVCNSTLKTHNST